MISDLFKSICHDQPKRVIKVRQNVANYTNYRVERERDERERFEHEHEREHDELMLFVRLVQRSRG